MSLEVRSIAVSNNKLAGFVGIRGFTAAVERSNLCWKSGIT